MKKYPACHPNRKYYAKGFCFSCYMCKLWRPFKAPKAGCHPELPAVARGLCNKCYLRETRGCKPRFDQKDLAPRLCVRCNTIKSIELYTKRTKNRKRNGVSYIYEYTPRVCSQCEHEARSQYRETQEGRKQDQRAHKEYNKKHRGRNAVRQNKRRQRICEEGTLTEEEWNNIITMYDSCCAYCGKKQESITMDHVIPFKLGGQHSRENVVPACRSCNTRKQARIWQPRPPQERSEHH